LKPTIDIPYYKTITSNFIRRLNDSQSLLTSPPAAHNVLLPEGEDMAVAEIDLKAIVRQKNVLDTTGHHSRPDILRLRIDRSERNVVEDMGQKSEEPTERQGRMGTGQRLMLCRRSEVHRSVLS